MITKQEAKQIIETSLNEIKNKNIQAREEIKLLEKYLSHKAAVVLTGVRRSGKTYLLFQLIKKLLEKKENVIYINFENPRFDSNVSQLDILYESFLEYKEHDKKIYFFLDEQIWQWLINCC